MSTKRTTDRLSSFIRAPPPSPIPTGRGSRSATDPAFSDYIEKSKQVPDLILPEHAHRLVPAEIDYQLLSVRDNDAVKRVVRSGREFGAFRLRGHGISTEHLRSALIENEEIFRLSPHFVWLPSDEAIMESVKQILGELHFHKFSQKIGNAARELEAIAKELAQVIYPIGNKQARHGHGSVTALTLHTNNQIPSPVDSESQQDSSTYAFSLNLVLEPGEFSLQLQRGGRLSFPMNPDTIVVTLGEQFKEWSLGELKSAEGEVIPKPNLHRHQASFSMELKWAFPIPNSENMITTNKAEKIISLTHQLLFLIVLLLVFNFFAFMYS